MLEGQRAPYGGDLLTLGRQSITCSGPEIEKQAARIGYRLASEHLAPRSRGISDEDFFRAIGFASISSLDANSYEDATFIHDLNDADVPATLESRFDTVIDRGTSEHVFHLPNLLGAVTRMVKPGGRIIHYVPSSNHIDHGFYMFSPTLFRDYYLANGFELPTMWLVAQPWLRARPCVEILEYRAGCLDPLSHGGLDSRAYQVFFVAVRPAVSTRPTIPQQARYSAAWSAGSADYAAGLNTPTAVLRRAMQPLVKRVRSTRIGDAIWGALINPVKKRAYMRRGPKLVLRHQL